MFILFDEFIMSYSQRRSGPMTVGNYGLTAPFINGFSLLLSTIQYPKSAVILLFLLFPILFSLFSFIIIFIINPFFNIDISISFIIFYLLISIIDLFIILAALSSSSKYSIIGSIRIMSIIFGFELIYSTLLVIIISYYYILSFLFIAIIFIIISFSYIS